MVSIEQTIFRGLLYDADYAHAVMPHLREEFFTDHHRVLFNVYEGLYDKYKTVPTLDALAIAVQKESIGSDTLTNIVELIEWAQTTKSEHVDLQWLIDETEQFCRDIAIYNAVYKSIDILDGNDKKLDKFAIPKMMEDALSISFDSSVGTDFFEDADKRYEEYNDEGTRIRLPLHALNVLTNGGLRKKTLSAFMAPINVGKSSIMAYLSGELLKSGYNVLYISMEMSESSVAQRIEANLLDVTTDDLPKMGKERYLGGLRGVAAKTRGRFFVKEYPTSSAHAGHFRHLLNELKQKKGFTPDIIMLDYINICASARYKSMTGVNSYTYVKAIAEEVRGLAVEFDVAIMTATQMNRGSFNDSSPDMTATSDSLGLPMSLDWLCAIVQDDVLKENKRQLFALLKTRWGDKSKIRSQVVGVNWSKMRYFDVEDGNNVPDAQPTPTRGQDTTPNAETASRIDFS